MRQFFYLFLIGLVLVIPFVLRRPADTMPAHSPSAQRLIIITPNNQDIRNEFGRAFDDWHQRIYGQAVEVDWRNVGGTNDVKRFLQTIMPGRNLRASGFTICRSFVQPQRLSGAAGLNRPGRAKYTAEHGHDWKHEM